MRQRTNAHAARAQTRGLSLWKGSAQREEFNAISVREGFSHSNITFGGCTFYFLIVTF